MTNHVEELLREGIDRAAARTDIGVPATLLHRARQHNRHRRQAIAAALAAGTAAVTAAAVIAATAGAPQASALHGQTITYVTTRAEQALAHISQSQAIETDTETVSNTSFGFMMFNLAPNPNGTSPQPPNALSNVHASRLVNWTDRDLLLQQGFSAAGKLVFTAAIGPVSTKNGQSVSEAYGAAYPDRIQWHTPITGGTAAAESPLTCATSGFDDPNWQQGITKALSCHVFTLAGNQEVNGIDTIKLIRKPTGGIGETLWVDPASYLPVRITTTFRQAPKPAAVQADDFRWRSPTTGNLAALHAAEQRGAIPSGFRSLPGTYVPSPGSDTPMP